MLFLDATGACLGRGITHVEAGSADFEGTAKQSRMTLSPLAIYEGSDKAAPLREHLDLVFDSWNNLICKGTIRQGEDDIPARPITSADMQGTKALYGMASSSHSVWCDCQGSESQHAYPKQPAKDYKDMCSMIAEMGCTIKDFDKLCRRAHYPPSVARGKPFREFSCDCCGYSPTEVEWRQDLAAFDRLSEEQQDERRRHHNEVGVGSSDVQQRRHHHQLLFMPPGIRNGMEHAGVDMLHLLYLNIFKTLFNLSIHQSLPDSKSTSSSGT